MLKPQEDFVFDLYKPFRNKLREVALIDSLYVIWCFSRNFTFNLPFPNDVQLPANFNPLAPINDRRYFGIPEFEQEFLMKEVILNSPSHSTPKSFKKTEVLRKVVNYMRQVLSEKIDVKYKPDNFLLQFNRIAHKQFVWQIPVTQRTILRYYKIFSDKDVDQLIIKKLTFSTHQIHTLGFFFHRWVGENFRTRLPFPSEHPTAGPKS